MGLLDAKTRILDTILTEEGRLQLSRGKLRIAHAAFSDTSVFYEVDAVSGSADPTRRVYFENNSLPQDQITFKADDSGKLLPLRSAVGLNVISGKLVSGSSLVPQQNDQFASLAGQLLDASERNFGMLNVIGTNDEFFEEDSFELSQTNVEFLMTNNVPIRQSDLHEIKARQLPGFITDPRMSHLPNFQFLPPVVRAARGGETKTIGGYVNIGDSDTEVHNRFKGALTELDQLGACKHISFDPTSRENNLFAQMFEVASDGTITKLDVLKFADPLDASKVIYFVGRVLVSADRDYRFLNMFTLVFER